MSATGTRTAQAPAGRGARRRLLAVLATAALSATLLGLGPDLARAASGPAWSITNSANPTNLSAADPAGVDSIQIVATNISSRPTDGTDITVTDTLPDGLTLDSSGVNGVDMLSGPVNCSGAQTVICTDASVLPPGESLSVVIPVDVAPDAPAQVTDTATVSGGGAQRSASASTTSQVTSATPAYGIDHFDGAVSAADGSGQTQAASHPYSASTTFDLPTRYVPSVNELQPVAAARDVTVDLPAGFVGNPTASPVRCTTDQLNTLSPNDPFVPSCPAASQVGIVTLRLRLSDSLDASNATFPLFNLVAPAGVPARFGFSAVGEPVTADATVRTGGDYGISITVKQISQGLSLLGTTITLWGAPADPSHDALRDNFCNLSRYFGGCSESGTAGSGSATPFLTNPTDCAAGPYTVTAESDSYQQPGVQHGASFVTHLPDGTQTGVTGCDRVPFTPSLTATPTTATANSPSGMAVDLHVPQTTGVNALAEGQPRNVTVALPTGMSVSPSAANGLAACTPQQIGLNNAAEPSCPDASKVGTVEVDTPLLSDPLVGSVYVAQQGDNPFGSLLAIYVTAEADGALVKLAGHVVADPQTGQLTATFSDNPQLPFSDFKLNFFTGPGAVFATPETCGTYSTTSTMIAWSGGAPVSSSSPFSVTNGCQSGFAPTFTAGSTNPQAGRFSPFTLSFARSATDQDLSGLKTTLPKGLLAKLAGVTECTGAAASTGACPANSAVGTVQVASGPGSAPYFLPGHAYLTGPYNGGPYGLAVVVPAVAGPFNLGTVVVRQSIRVDPETARVSVVSDPFPTILQGIPIRIASVSVDLNRPNFTINPTSCNPTSVTGTLYSVAGTEAHVSSRYQVGGCQALRFSPSLKIGLKGRKQTRSGDHPPLTAVLRNRLGDANLTTARVALPLSLALDPDNAQHVCDYDKAKAVHGGAVPCSAKTVIGTAIAQTPLLDHPLNGRVYLVQGIRFGKNHKRIKTLPTLLVALRGQIALDLRADTSVDRANRLVTTFRSIPDASVSTFTLRITGGHRGLLVVTGSGKSICGAPQVATAKLSGHSGATHSLSDTLTTPCKKPAKKRSHTV